MLMQGQTKTFSLVGAPAGAGINASSGVFTWTPTATGSYTFKVRVTDNGTPVLFDEEQITVTVSATFSLTSKTNNEGINSRNYQSNYLSKSC
jgi:hypothetical protein